MKGGYLAVPWQMSLTVDPAARAMTDSMQLMTMSTVMSANTRNG